MRKYIHPAIIVVVLLCHPAFGVPKSHVISFGKWIAVKVDSPDDAAPVDLRVRALFVDTRLKEYTSGAPHEVTDRLFVVRRMFRVNDALPHENASSARWVWQKGGWLVVDRLTGRVSQMALPEFDVSASEVAWYRDYAAYCGVSDDGKNVFAIVMQIGRRKPVLKKGLGSAAAESITTSCLAPEWQRQPIRVIFGLPNGQKLTYSVRGNTVNVVNDSEEEEGE